MSLKELLGEELYSQVNEKLDDDTKLIVNDGSYIPKEKFDAKIEKINALEEQIKQRDQQISTLKEDTNASEELKSKIEELQEKNEQTQTELQEKLKQQKLEAEIDKALIKRKARNPKAVKALLEMDKVEVNDDGVKGLDEQLEAITESDDYLFETEDKKPGKTAGDFNGNKNKKNESVEEWAKRTADKFKNY